MFKKSITFEDFDGKTVTEDFFFNLTKAELIELEVGEKNGLSATLQAIVAAEDMEKIIAYFKKIILMSYGEKSPDGRRFVKNDDVREGFSQTAAYSELFMELATDGDAASQFITQLIPGSMAPEVKKEIEKQVAEISAPSTEPKKPQDMTREELLEAIKSKSQQ